MRSTVTIARITRAYVRTYSDNGQITAYVEWLDSKGGCGRTEGPERNAHMAALIKRAQREGITLMRETW